MSNLTEQSNWEEGIYQLEETDLVIAGPNGIANQQAKQLANRTLWLYNAIGGVVGFTTVTADKVLTKGECYKKMVVIDAQSASIALTLPELSANDAGFSVMIKALILEKQARVSSLAENILLSSTAGIQNIYLGSMEEVELYWNGAAWIVFNFNGNFFDVGKVEFDYVQRINTVLANGQELNRADYPRLWAFAQNIGGSLVSQFTWSLPGRKGYFSTGNGTTTFRVPDLRGMFIRGLDLGAGISLGRNSSLPGGYEADEFKSHTHSYLKARLANVGIVIDTDIEDGSEKDLRGETVTSGATGGLETRSKNIGLIPLIKI